MGKTKQEISSGMRFGKLTVIEPADYLDKNGKKSKGYLCKCDCGNTKVIKREGLISGKTKSCGCLIKEFNAKRGQFYDNPIEEYGANQETARKIAQTLKYMKQRCYYPNNRNYKNYGGRGIKICAEWLEDKNKFVKWAFENGYKEGLSIDRIDVNGDYSPQNCRWVDRYAQANNTRTNTYIYYNGEKYTITQLSRILGIGRYVFSALASKHLQISDL